MTAKAYNLAFAAALLAAQVGTAAAQQAPAVQPGATLMLASPGTEIGRAEQNGRMAWQPATTGTSVVPGERIKGGKDGAVIQYGDNRLATVPAGEIAVVSRLPQGTQFGQQTAQFFGEFAGYSPLLFIIPTVAIPLGFGINQLNNDDDDRFVRNYPNVSPQ